jgi:hypothetical protein
MYRASEVAEEVTNWSLLALLAEQAATAAEFFRNRVSIPCPSTTTSSLLASLLMMFIIWTDLANTPVPMIAPEFPISMVEQL